MYILVLAEYVLWVPASIARLPGPAGLLCERFRHRAIHWTNSHESTGRFIHCCLAAPLSVPGRLGAGTGGVLGDSATAGQLYPARRRHAQLSAHQQQQPAAAPASNAVRAANWRDEGLGPQVGASMMSWKLFKQSCQVQVQKFYQSDKTKSWSGLKLSSADGDWDVDLQVEQWLEYRGYYYKIFKQSCKVQRFYQRDKTKSWSGLKSSSADGERLLEGSECDF